MKRTIQIALAGLVLSSSCVFADSISNTASGDYSNNGSQVPGSSYYTGNVSGSYFNNYFEFILAGESGTVTSATFDVDAYVPSLPFAVTYDIFETSLDASISNSCSSGCISQYNGLVSGTLIGSVSIGPTDNNKTLAISLNSAGLNWLSANVGGVVVIGGNIGTQPAVQGQGPGVFVNSTFNSANALILTTVQASTPEPGTVAMLVLGLGAIAVSRRRRFFER